MKANETEVDQLTLMSERMCTQLLSIGVSLWDARARVPDI
jgi:hypothetical protein